MNYYYILGSGGFAKEVYFHANQILGDEFNFQGFIEKEIKENTIKIGKNYFPVLKESDFLNANKSPKNISLLMGIGNPFIISKLKELFSNFEFPNIIHPSFIGDRDSISIGKGNIITPGCIFTSDIKIGSFNIFNLNTTIGHDSVIIDCNVFNPGCNISGGVVIGSRNLFGTNCAVLQYLTIGDDCTIGAMSLVNRNLTSNITVVGVPAKPLIK